MVGVPWVGFFVWWGKLLRTCFPSAREHASESDGNLVRTPHSQIEELALQAKSAGVFAFGENPAFFFFTQTKTDLLGDLL